MLHVSVNGESRSIADNSTIADLLQELKINSRYCAVEQNREIVPREEHDRTRLNDGDALEIVTLVGGG